MLTVPEHGEMEEGKCPDCHRMEDPGAEYVHMPVVQGKCLVCHSQISHEPDGPLPDETPLETLIEQEIEICFECHRDMGRGSNHPVGENVVDPQGKMITCTSHCHDPHSSQHEYLLRKEGGKELCLSCHTEFIK